VRWATRTPCRSIPAHQKAGAVGNKDTLPITIYSSKYQCGGQHGHLADQHLLTKKPVRWAIRTPCPSLSTHQNASAVGNTDTLPINTCSPKSRCSGQYGHIADHYLLTKKLVALCKCISPVVHHT
jgi:hypothetical protein